MAGMVMLGLSACNGEAPPDTATIGNEVVDLDKRETIWGEGGGLDLTKGGPSRNSNGSPSIGVNAFLWRAALDTISIWPVSSADPFGGVVITDWYSPPASPNERFKLNVYILDRSLRADGIRVGVFRQILGQAGDWRTAPVQSETQTKLENAILMRARQFRRQYNRQSAAG